MINLLNVAVRSWGIEPEEAPRVHSYQVVDEALSISPSRIESVYHGNGEWTYTYYWNSPVDIEDLPDFDFDE